MEDGSPGPGPALSGTDHVYVCVEPGLTSSSALTNVSPGHRLHAAAQSGPGRLDSFKSSDGFRESSAEFGKSDAGLEKSSAGFPKAGF